MDPLQRYLQQQSSDGQLESSGSFTLVWKKAQEKLRQFQLESPAHYVLKLVQAAVSAGAPRVDFRIGAKELYCYFCLGTNSSELALDSVAAALATPPAEECPLRHLIVGLNASFMGNPQDILWGVWDHLEGDAILFAQDQSDQHTGLPHPLPKVARAGEKLYVFRLTRPKRAGSAEEHALLVERCGYSPVPIYVDSKMVESPRPRLDKPSFDLSVTRPYFLLRHLQNPTSGQIGVRLGDPRDWLLSGEFRRRPNPSHDCLKRQPYLLHLDPETALSGNSERTRCTASVSLDTNLEGNSYLYLVRFGVTMKTIQLGACPFGADVIMEGEKLKVDISEFNVVQDTAFKSSRTEARALLKKIGFKLMKVDGLPGFPQDEAGEQLGKLFCCCALGWASIFLVAYEAVRIKKRNAAASGKLDAAVQNRARMMARL